MFSVQRSRVMQVVLLPLPVFIIDITSSESEISRTRSNRSTHRRHSWFQHYSLSSCFGNNRRKQLVAWCSMVAGSGPLRNHWLWSVLNTVRPSGASSSMRRTAPWTASGQCSSPLPPRSAGTHRTLKTGTTSAASSGVRRRSQSGAERKHSPRQRQGNQMLSWKENAELECKRLTLPLLQWMIEHRLVSYVWIDWNRRRVRDVRWWKLQWHKVEL